MGQRGPQPLPANVHLLKGNPSKKPVSQLLGEFKPEVDVPDCPPVLWPEAKRHWKELTQELYRYGLISKLDRAMLAFGCQEWARWHWAEKKIRDLNRADPSGEAGLIDKAPSGYRMQSVYLQISVKAQERYEKVVNAFGLSAASRSRVTPSDNYPFLPGMEPSVPATGETPPVSSLTLSQLAR
jgi:P27 family predicted phage terminase small subunit